MNFAGILSTTNQPAVNLATEEYLLKKRNENIFFLYDDCPSIICGKHQNTLAETNFQVARSLSLKVYRRLSGGGTVYHDEGNLNFCFITNEPAQHMIDFKRYSQPILEILNNLGVKAYFGGRNDFLIDGKKISGNACHVYKNRVMHHGTLLFNSNLSNLGSSLKIDPTKYTDKAVKSVRSVVTNISEHIKPRITFHEFKSAILTHIVNGGQINLSETEMAEINHLAETKYATWEWNYGYSPEYKFKKRLSFPNVLLTMHAELGVQKGIVQTISVLSNKEANAVKFLFAKLEGQPHRLETFVNIIGEDLSQLLKMDANEVLIQFF
ncbi:MAG: lipoate--protein ligase [Breznakibacter sp.]